MHAGFRVDQSSDPGRFVCNYIFYESLRHCMHATPENVDGGPCMHSLFVHMPFFGSMNEDEQVRFVTALLVSIQMHLLQGQHKQ